MADYFSKPKTSNSNDEQGEKPVLQGLPEEQYKKVIGKEILTIKTRFYVRLCVNILNR